MNDEYWIIEHPSRGVFVGMKDGKPRFRWSILRNEGRHFTMFEAVQWHTRMNVPRSYVLRMPARHERTPKRA